MLVVSVQKIAVLVKSQLMILLVALWGALQRIDGQNQIFSKFDTGRRHAPYNGMSPASQPVSRPRREVGPDPYRHPPRVHLRTEVIPTKPRLVT